MWKQAQYLQGERQFGFIFTKYRSQGVRMKKKKDQGAWTRSHVLSVRLRTPPIFLAPAATDGKYNKKRIPNINITCKPFFNGTKITMSDVKLISLLTTCQVPDLVKPCMI